LKCNFLQISDIRIPNFRCAFFRREGEFDMLEFENPQPNTVIAVEKPKYLKLIDGILKKNKSLLGRLDRVRRFLTGENIEPGDPNVIVKKSVRFLVSAREELNKTTYGFIRKSKLEDLRDVKFIFFGFHKQPEASIDVHGRYSEDQFLIVTNLWRLLPHGWKLVVKEHTNAVGDRSYRFYQDLLKYPGIILVEEKIDSKILVAKSELVVTVCGTMSYEAALMGKPSITLARVFFNGINYCRYMPFSELTRLGSMVDLINDLKAQPDNRIEFSNFLMKNSFEGYVSDYYTDLSVLSEDNVTKLANAFTRLLGSYGVAESLRLR
jgi:hypothetical protein